MTLDMASALVLPFRKSATTPNQGTTTPSPCSCNETVPSPASEDPRKAPLYNAASGAQKLSSFELKIHPAWAEFQRNLEDQDFRATSVMSIHVTHVCHCLPVFGGYKRSKASALRTHDMASAIPGRCHCDLQRLG
jgi:hypothetical protein